MMSDNTGQVTQESQPESSSVKSKRRRWQEISEQAAGAMPADKPWASIREAGHDLH